jgi:hypothetical protein
MALGDYLLVSATCKWCTRKEEILGDLVKHITVSLDYIGFAFYKEVDGCQQPRLLTYIMCVP